MVSIGKKYKDNPPKPTEKSNLIAEITSIGGLFASILGGSVVSLISFPLVDYAVPVPQNSSKVTVEVRNIGFTSAKNVVVSLHADRENFSNLTAEPYIGDEFKKEITSSGYAYGSVQNESFYIYKDKKTCITVLI